MVLFKPPWSARVQRRSSCLLQLFPRVLFETTHREAQISLWHVVAPCSHASASYHWPELCVPSCCLNWARSLHLNLMLVMQLWAEALASRKVCFKINPPCLWKMSPRNLGELFQLEKAWCLIKWIFGLQCCPNTQAPEFYLYFVNISVKTDAYIQSLCVSIS